MSTSTGSYKIEQAKVQLSSGRETSVSYAVPDEMREPTTSIIIAHGAGGPMHSPFVRYFHQELAKQGYLSLKFNFSYMEAHRKVPDKNEVLESEYRTIIGYVRNGKHKTSRIVVGGKSMGGRIASQAVAKNGVEVDGLFFLGYPLHPPGNMDRLRDQHLYTIKEPMLFLSGTRDSFAKKDLLERVVKKIGANAQLSWIDDGDHSFKKHIPSQDKDGAEEALAILLRWLDKLS